MREPLPRLRLRAKLLQHGLQRLRVRAYALLQTGTNVSLREFRSMNAQIQSLQEQVNELYGQLNALRGGATAPYPMQQLPPPGESSASYRNPMSPSQPRGSHPQFQGHTSNQYNFDVAKSSLQTMGISEPEAADEGVGNEIDPALGAPIRQQAPMAPMVTQVQKDPLWQLSRDEAIRLCKVYDEEMGMMHPLIDMGKTMEQASLFFSFTESAARTGLFRRDKPGKGFMGGHDVNIIKMILANALTIEEYGRSALGQALYDSCREQIENRLSGPIEIKGLVLLVMVVSRNGIRTSDLADHDDRLSTSSSKMRRSKPIVSLGLLLVSVSSLDCTVARPCSRLSQMMKIVLGLSSCSGQSTSWIDDGALVPECRLPCRTLILTQLYQSRSVLDLLYY